MPNTNESTPDSCVCPVVAATTSTECGEEETLRIMRKFKKFYEDRLSEIDADGGGDCSELKLKIQQRWIDDLTEQTKMMARIVKELEAEATARVRMLEDKLRQTSRSAYEVMKRYQTYNVAHNLDEPFQKVFYLESDLKNLLEFIKRVRNDGKWSIDGLQFYDVTYCDLFGKENCDCETPSKDPNVVSVTNGVQPSKKGSSPRIDKDEALVEFSEEQFKPFEEVAEQLKKKSEEYEALKQAMVDMRSALTEEVACKHDMISALKKDIQQLEERCVQADKQTAFKDDIIKELRKEIKQLKQQSTDKDKEIADLKKKLEDAQTLMSLMRPCVDMKTAHTMIDEGLVIKKSKLIQNKDEVIQIQNDTLNVIQLELQGTRVKERELEEEICRRQCEVEDLECKCKELEDALTRSQGIANNLQNAVALYLNSINVLEAAEERAKIEIEQQRMTIANLQEALVNVKQELDEVRQKNQQEVQTQQYLVDVLYVNILDLEKKNEICSVEISQLTESYKKLQDCNFELEVEHFNTLQDLAILETQLYKYQIEFRSFEDCKNSTKNELKKLRQQKRCYEHVVDCFKQEMAVMAEQLIHLQELLNLSNQSCKEENGQLYNAIVGLQDLSKRLQGQLKDTEKKVILENQMNQLKDAKIDELQLIIGQKNADLNVHDQAISDMKARLENSFIDNHELQATVASLNSTVMHLQCALQTREVEKSQKTENTRSKLNLAKKSLSELRDDLEKKNRKLEKLQGEYRDQYEMLKSAQKELEKAKNKNKEKTKELKSQNEQLREKVNMNEIHNQQLIDELAALREKTGRLAQEDCLREHEVAQYKQTIIELRQTLIELNENLAETEQHHVTLAEEYYKNQKENKQQEDIYMSCRCEIEMYKKLTENLKTSLAEARVQLTDVEAQNKSLNTELVENQAKLGEIQKKLVKKEKETNHAIKELAEKLEDSQNEEKRLLAFIETLKEEVQKKIDQSGIKEANNKVIGCICENTDMASTQEELTTLKVDIRNMIENQIALNSENDKLLQQVTRLQAAVNTAEEKNRCLKEKLEKAFLENQNLKDHKKMWLAEKEAIAQSVRNLEQELAEARNNRDDVCAESRHVVNNVKAWLEEQRKINDRMRKKAQCYCNTIQKLKQENEYLSCQSQIQPRPQPILKKPNRNCTCYTPPPPSTVECQNAWCLGSQGTGSLDVSPRDSPSSFLTCSIEEWYSPTYREDDETDDHEDCLINQLEAVTLEMRNSNKKWKAKCEEFLVSKDDK